MLAPLERTMETTAQIPKTIARTARQVTEAVHPQVGRAEEPGLDDAPAPAAGELDVRQRRRCARTLHVEPHAAAWVVRVHGTDAIEHVARDRAAAFSTAQRRASLEGRRLFLHRDDGTIERMISYRRDGRE